MAADPNGYKNAIANPVILKHANSITAENAFKPDAIGHGRQLQLGHGR